MQRMNKTLLKSGMVILVSKTKTKNTDIAVYSTVHLDNNQKYKKTRSRSEKVKGQNVNSLSLSLSLCDDFSDSLFSNYVKY